MQLIRFGLLACIYSVVGLAELTGLTIGSLHINNPPMWLVFVAFLAVPACFVYPMVILWPARVRPDFRDRLPLRR